MQELIEKYKQEVNSFHSKDSQEIETFRIKYLGKNGILNQLFSDFKNVDPSQKKEVGMLINTLKTLIIEKINKKFCIHSLKIHHSNQDVHNN